jgi:hypothetical protein
MGGLRFVGLGFAKIPDCGRDRGDRGGEEGVTSNAVCALDGTGEDADAAEPPVRGLTVLDALLLLPLCLAARRRFRISLALTV